jgi:hypothetical protein
MTQNELDHLFTYHLPVKDQPERYQRLRAAAREFALAVVAESGESFEQQMAIMKIREAVMWANAGIACE